MPNELDSYSQRGFPFIAAAVALVFIMVGGAVAWGVQKCGDTDFKISMKDGLQLTCKAPSALPTTTPATDPKAIPTTVRKGELGYVYYGRKKIDGLPSDRGKLRPASNKPLPLPNQIKEGDIFTGTDIKQLRIGSSTNSATKQVPAGTCYSTVKVDRYLTDNEADGAWLEVQTIDCQ